MSDGRARRMAVILIFICLGVMVIASCSRQKEVRQRKSIGIALLTRAHIFYRDLEEGLRDDASKHTYELIFTAADFDLGRQTSQIEDFVARKVDAIVVCPVDSRGIGPAIRTANSAGIPVFTADIAAFEGDVICHIASDNVAGGRLAGEYLARILNGRGNIAVINHPVVTSVLDRVQGFKEGIGQFPGIKIVADIDGGGVRDKSLQVAADVLQSHPRLNGIFGINDDSALGALDAVQQFKRSTIVIVGYDATPPARDAILKGSPLKADVIQYPKTIGRKTVEMIHEYFGGKPVPKLVPVEVGIVDRDALMNVGAN
jgi:ribose transport system substrate-binding protein